MSSLVPNMAKEEVAPQELEKRIALVSRLPLLFTTAVSIDRTFTLALKYLRNELNAEAATLFYFDEPHNVLRWWALDGGAEQLKCADMPANRGIAGWVVAHQESVLANDPHRDSRFDPHADQVTSFKTKNLICVPLCGFGSERLGAIQILNSTSNGFTENDLALLECVSPQFVLGMQNALLREKLESSNKKLNALRKKRSDMLSVLSHEFRSPLGIIQASGDLLAKGNLPSGLRSKTSEKLNDAVQRLIRLVGGMRNAAAVDAGETPLSKSLFSISNISDGIITQLSEATKAIRKLTFEQSIEPKLLVAGDDVLFTIALSNLLHNAVRFTPDGGKIRIEAKKKLGVVQIDVSDTGIGIAEDEREAIFEKFYEVGDILAHSSGNLAFKSGGLGLGLATVKSILDAHKASLEVVSSKSGGSTFRIRMVAASES